ncbi:hypothetical protein BmR1_04g09840 [Babesia microti strain RI]|uniref:Uncharacterized protein n=1 Tax=Babesia microti (strain RI) TaxID=1133968 RepID=A0A1N6LYI0_BABMR|nr:hypothetical protein BmR1_04g09840 [Babesia microti strain RI]SIO73925.1 hypothetical protein BmR1_04g09840 [Babesia microti strain RI]|eukprot:XP_021337972.1 hypothetical protein BmR1_04g09840 [Babesia microti strain RI]
MDELYQQYRHQALMGLELAESKLSTQGSKFKKALLQIENSIHQMQLEASNFTDESYTAQIEEYRQRYLKLLHSSNSSNSLFSATEPLLNVGFKHLEDSRAIVDEVNRANTSILEELFAQRDRINSTIARLVFQGEYLDRADTYLTKLQIGRNLTGFVWKFIAVLAISAILVVVSVKLL